MAMSANHNKTPGKSVGLGVGSSGNLGQTMPMNSQPHLLSQTQPQTPGGPPFPGHFQLSEPQAQALAQTQYAQAHAQAQAQAAHAQFQAQLQAQAQSLAQLHSTGSSNLGVSSPTISTPGAGSAKRANQKPPSRPHASANASSPASPFKTMEVTPAAWRKKPKLPDNQIPEKIAALVPESAIYAV